MTRLLCRERQGAVLILTPTFTHERIIALGSRLAPVLIRAVREHHDPRASETSNVGASVLNLACGVVTRFGLDLPGEADHWALSTAKLTMAGVTGETLEKCTENARAHYQALCAILG